MAESNSLESSVETMHSATDTESAGNQSAHLHTEPQHATIAHEELKTEDHAGEPAHEIATPVVDEKPVLSPAEPVVEEPATLAVSYEPMMPEPPPIPPPEYPSVNLGGPAPL